MEEQLGLFCFGGITPPFVPQTIRLFCPFVATLHDRCGGGHLGFGLISIWLTGTVWIRFGSPWVKKR